MLRPDLPRTDLSQDLFYTVGDFLSVCEIRRHDAVRQLDSLARTGHDPGWADVKALPGTTRDVDEPPSEKAASSIDVQRYAADQISASIAEQFTGNGPARLIRRSSWLAACLLIWRRIT